MNTGVIIFLLIILILMLIKFKSNSTIENFAISNNDIKTYFDDKLHKSYPNHPVKEGQIFVSVASYRDDECSDTIRSLYDNAENPENIYVGICSQNHPDEVKEECLPNNYKYKNNIRVNRLKHTDALGPNYARYLCSHLWD